jgi:hypothetical protein
MFELLNISSYAHQVPRIEQCWRNLARAFGKNLTELRPAREPVVSFYCCNQIAISRDHIRRHPVEHYRAAYELIGLKEKCSEGWIDARENWAMGNMCYRESPPEWFSEGRESKSAQAGAMEHLTHFVLDDEPLISIPYTEDHYCRNFLPSSQCPGSPCPR